MVLVVNASLSMGKGKIGEPCCTPGFSLVRAMRALPRCSATSAQAAALAVDVAHCHFNNKLAPSHTLQLPRKAQRVTATLGSRAGWLLPACRGAVRARCSWGCGGSAAGWRPRGGGAAGGLGGERHSQGLPQGP